MDSHKNRENYMLNNPMTNTLNTYFRQKVFNRFSALSKSSHEYYLSLIKYINHIPEKYYNKEIYESLLEWLKERHSKNELALKEYFVNETINLSKAFLFLRQINQLNIHDDLISSIDDFDLLKTIDDNIHPIYLRLVEAIFKYLIKPIAYFSRIDRNKSVDGLDVYNIVEEIKLTPYKSIIIPYNDTMRNGIAHGGIKYLNNEIEYIDKKGNTIILYHRDVIKTFDDMVDLCNSMALAIKLFLILHKQNEYLFPHEFLIEEIIEETKSPWMSVEGCIETTIPNGNQLLLYARPNTSDYNKVLFLSLHIAVLAEFLSPGFERYFLSLKSSKCKPGWAIFRGTELKKAREIESQDFIKYSNVLEPPGLFFIPRIKVPRLIFKIDSLIKAFQNTYKVLSDTFHNSSLQAIISVKAGRMHRNSWGMVLSGEAIVEVKTNIDISVYIKKNCNKLINKIYKTAKLNKSLLSIERYLPIGYAQISIFSKQLRKRSVAGYGLGKELICTIRLQRIKRIKSPDIIESKIEQNGVYRIAWNKNWLTACSNCQP